MWGVYVREIVVFQGDGANGLPGTPGRQGEPGDRVSWTHSHFTMTSVMINNINTVSTWYDWQHILHLYLHNPCRYDLLLDSDLWLIDHSALFWCFFIFLRRMPKLGDLNRFDKEDLCRISSCRFDAAAPSIGKISFCRISQNYIIHRPLKYTWNCKVSLRTVVIFTTLGEYEIKWQLKNMTCIDLFLS